MLERIPPRVESTAGHRCFMCGNINLGVAYLFDRYDANPPTEWWTCHLCYTGRFRTYDVQ